MKFGLTEPMVAMVIMGVSTRSERSTETPTTAGKILLPLSKTYNPTLKYFPMPALMSTGLVMKKALQEVLLVHHQYRPFNHRRLQDGLPQYG